MKLSDKLALARKIGAKTVNSREENVCEKNFIYSFV